ncbi:MAG: hypothetical protein ABSB74_13860 [Tepidisphaeraceae bacterium]
MSKNRRIATVAGLMAAAGIFSSTPAHGSVVIGTWTSDTSDQWIDWSSQSGYSGGATSLPTPKFTFANDGVAGGDSLLLTKAGWNQNLAVKLEYIPGDMAAFFANNAIQVEITLPATSTSGWSQIYEVAVNAPGWGFKDLTADPVPGAQWGWGGSGGPQTTYTLTFDYSAALASIPANAGYVELIFATNNDGTHDQYYFDNVQLVTIPEPATSAVLCGAALPLLARRRRR